MDPQAMKVLLGVVTAGLFLFWFLPGLYIIQPRHEGVVVRWGRFDEVKRQEGLYFSNPWGRNVKKVSTQDTTLEIPRATVVDAHGNPVELSAIVVYRIADSRRAALDVENPRAFVRDQATAVMKRVAAQFPYESPDPDVPCLRKESDEVEKRLLGTLGKVVEPAGVRILGVRLNDLAYAPEIAQAMLMRQQAQAMIAARRTLVEGAVGIVRDAVDLMSKQNLQLSLSRQEELVSNLLVVLCSSERVQPTMQVSQGHARASVVSEPS